MAQASSAQREPSMEEILASIRRIIEDSDTTRKQGEEQLAARREQESVVVSEPRPVTGSVVEVDAFRAELRGASEPAVEATSAAPGDSLEKKPVTLAEVQAQIARESYYSAPTPVAPVEAEDDPEAPLEVADDLDDDLDIANELADPIEMAEAVLAAREPEPVQTVAAAETSSPQQAPKTAIISEHAGRQVAAAFGELSDVFATRKKSFDELAEEMMRPMLQDWLDNNLPVLVERLVREEIERVARGGVR
ncbi:hypothetical protein SAMN04488498_10874 [Mesorhizobium albiziae]|uniref:Cell pole-organizing protein PopZ n=1 Tax=Neomesorhizobium albiziae TaxID=335020 RepID=A0A1I4AHA6_9HYPH|nr:PopZ family protein [Mesorhizobium albiziae]SFK55808.1 hypothetical protein SAMN04488498_10874 [Mesorhizobium albiziae]